MCRGLLLAVVFCLSAVPVYAQTAASYDLTIYTPGSTQPQTRNVLAAAVQCDQPAPTVVTVNPTAWTWPDSVRPGRFCKTDDTLRMNALPEGTFNGTVTAISATGVRGVESASSPFTRLLLQSLVVTGLKFSN